MLKIPVNTRYISSDKKIVLYYSDRVIIGRKHFHLFLIATKENIIHTIAVFPVGAVKFDGNKVIVKSTETEIFYKA